MQQGHSSGHSPNDPDETVDVRELAKQLIHEPQQWMDSPNDLFGGLSPNKAIENGHEDQVRNVLRAFKHGVFS